MKRTPIKQPAGAPKLNDRQLVMVAVAGHVAPPLAKSPPYRVGQDGCLRILPGSGGITLSHRIGDLCVGIAGDHVEPGVSVHSRTKGSRAPHDGPNLGLNTFSCVGNSAVVMTGPATGSRGIVTGKHGGIANVLVDFPQPVLKQLRIGDAIQIYAVGQGLKLCNAPAVAVMNASPRLIKRWGLHVGRHKLSVPVTHVMPAAIMGSGLGKSSAARGDYDAQLFDDAIVRKFRLGSLRFGDLVAILGADGRYGRSYSSRHVTVGVVVHSDSTVAGHGPGISTLLTGPARAIALERNPDANIARILDIRALARPLHQTPLIASERCERLPTVGQLRS